MTTESIVRQAVEAYDAADMERVAALVAENVHYHINAAPDCGPYVADCQCKADFFGAVGEILADWDIDSYKIADMIVSGDRAAVQIAIEMTSKHTGKQRTAALALFVTVKDGQLSEIIEYHDTKMVATARDG